MAIQIQLRSGTTTEHNTFTGVVGEVTVDTTNKTLRVHDGSTVGGTRLATLTEGLVPTTQLPAATTSVQGAVILNNTLTSASITQALTAAQGKILKDSLDASSFGVGQTYSDVTASRVSGTTYTNSSTRPIMLSIVVRDGGGSATLYVNSSIAIRLDDLFGGSYGHVQIVAVVPSGQTYKLDATGNLITFWGELR